MALSICLSVHSSAASLSPAMHTAAGGGNLLHRPYGPHLLVDVKSSIVTLHPLNLIKSKSHT